MPAADDSPDGCVHDPLDQLCHELKTPLTTILGRAHLLARAVRRTRSLTDDERTRMLEGLAAIDTAVAAMVAIIDDMDGDHLDGGDERTDGPS